MTTTKFEPITGEPTHCACCDLAKVNHGPAGECATAEARYATGRSLYCCVCGDDAGRFEQHWNRDTGYGICRKCVEWLKTRGTSADEMLSLYGIEGVNYATAESEGV